MSTLQNVLGGIFEGHKRVRIKSGHRPENKKRQLDQDERKFVGQDEVHQLQDETLDPQQLQEEVPDQLQDDEVQVHHQLQEEVPDHHQLQEEDVPQEEDTNDQLQEQVPDHQLQEQVPDHQLQEEEVHHRELQQEEVPQKRKINTDVHVWISRERSNVVG